jgi:hypothetical protein
MRLFLVCFLFLSWISSVSAQALYQGNIIVDGYLGFPNFGKLVMSSTIQHYSISNISGFPPSGFKGEYMISDNIGLGFDMNSNYVKAEYSSRDTTILNDILYVSVNNYITTMNRFRFQARFNYHFDTYHPFFDSYFGIGIGSNKKKYSSYKNGIDNTKEFTDEILLILPFSMRVCVGGRYYFSQNFGISGEFGVGGPLISVGLSLKI